MSLLRYVRQLLGPRISVAGVALAVFAVALMGNVSPAAASTTQLSLFQVPDIEGTPANPQDPAPMLQILRSLGANVVQVGVGWADIAPNSNSRVRPIFNASDPNAYPASNWAPLDRLVHEAQSYGIQLDFILEGGAPLWATQTGAPPCDPNGGACYDNGFEPSASEYGQFVHAVATRYPSVHFWEIWNEANWGPALTPQYLNSSVPVSAYVYRGLLDAGWNALQATGHGGDTIVITSLSQDGSSPPVGETGTTAPLTFIRTLWCADSSYAHLTGAAASQAGCPTTTAGYQQFEAAHPALFQASGVGVHPYPYGGPPTHIDFPSPDGLEFAEIPQLTTALDKLERLYAPSGSSRQMSAFNTEYGYRTRPNDTQTFFTTPDNAAAYINQAEYLSWKNPRIASYDQYELYEGGWFPTGLFFAPQTVACPGTVACPKPSFVSYRFPVWLPLTATPKGGATEVWGHARPAYFARLDTGQPQTVLIQWAPGSTGQFQTVKAVQTDNLGFFDTQVNFRGSGQVRLAWQYPAGDAALRDPLDPSSWIYSRVTNLTIYQHKASGYLRVLSKGHLTLGLTVKKGTGAPPITAVTVRPPKGLKLRCVRTKKKAQKNKACSGLVIRKGKVNRVGVSGGKFVLSLTRPASTVSITGVPPFVRAAGGLSGNHKKLKFKLSVLDANGAQSTITVKVKAT
jgi:hypothetical protein